MKARHLQFFPKIHKTAGRNLAPKCRNRNMTLFYHIPTDSCLISTSTQAHGHSTHSNLLQPRVFKYQMAEHQVLVWDMDVCVCVRGTCGCLLWTLWRMQPQCLRHADQQIRLRGLEFHIIFHLASSRENGYLGTAQWLVQGEVL